MLTRVFLWFALWAAMIVGVVQLLAHGAAPTGVAIGIVAGVLGTHAYGVARRRWQRLRSWPRPGEIELETGPRRVLLLETGLAGPE